MKSEKPKTVANLKVGDTVILFNLEPLFIEGVIKSISPVGKRSLLLIRITGKYQNKSLGAYRSVRHYDTFELLNSDMPLSAYGTIALKKVHQPRPERDEDCLG